MTTLTRDYSVECDDPAPDWGDIIPINGEVDPAECADYPTADATRELDAYEWLVASGIPAPEAAFRVYGAAGSGYARPLVAQRRWTEMFGGDGDGCDEGCNPATVAPEWQPSKLALALVLAL